MLPQSAHIMPREVFRVSEADGWHTLPKSSNRTSSLCVELFLQTSGKGKLLWEQNKAW